MNCGKQGRKFIRNTPSYVDASYIEFEPFATVTPSQLIGPLSRPPLL